MKTKKLLLITSFLSGTLFCSGQTLSPNVISPAGGFTSGSSGSLSSTTGEMTMVATFTAGSIAITQGFQQADNHTVAVEPIEKNESAISIGPNPSTGILNVFFHSTKGMKINFRFIDIKGTVVYESIVEKAENNNYVSFDLSRFTNGTYIIEGIDIGTSKNKQNQFTQKFTITK